ELSHSKRTTLGFSHIYVVNLEYRIDRHEKMEVLGKYLGLDLDFFKAVSRLSKSNLTVGAKACYLSHYRIFESIVKNGYENALILEDDVDMEVNITDIMTEVHHNLPNDWDMLYLGHCDEWDSNYFKTNLTVHILHTTGHPKCTHAYAVSAKGAKKLIEKLNIDNPKDHLDK
ncbi:33802_t:CDS:1, partial [Racocetra persica]